MLYNINILTQKPWIKQNKQATILSNTLLGGKKTTTTTKKTIFNNKSHYAWKSLIYLLSFNMHSLTRVPWIRWTKQRKQMPSPQPSVELLHSSKLLQFCAKACWSSLCWRMFRDWTASSKPLCLMFYLCILQKPSAHCLAISIPETEILIYCMLCWGVGFDLHNERFRALVFNIKSSITAHWQNVR